MERFNFSLATIFHRDREAEIDVRCRVEISSDRCVVVYDQDADAGDVKRTAAQWEGHSLGQGHYQLVGDVPGRIKGSCKATLHRFDDSRVLEGFWKEAGFTGMWRIELKN